jgi:ABC-2 type transport system permease protein
VATFVENKVFLPEIFATRDQELSQQVLTGKVTAGIVIPPDLEESFNRGESVELQVFIDGVDANTAGIAAGYISQMINRFNQSLTSVPRLITPQVRFLYNPGLISSWFFVPGMIGVVLTLTGSLVSSVTVVKEKDTGTLEQLLMTPAAGWEILLAKIIPLFVLVMGDVVLALSVGRLVFDLPFRGNLLLFLVLSGLYVFVGIGVGIMLATISVSQQQAVLSSFFINLPLIQLSGAIAPVETMPTFFQYLSLINPLRHYITILRGIVLKGVGLEVLWPHVIALGTFAVVLLAVSINRFRKQLS